MALDPKRIVNVTVEPGQTRVFLAGLQDEDGEGGYVAADLTGYAVEAHLVRDGERLERSLAEGTIEAVEETLTDRDGTAYAVTSLYVLFTTDELEAAQGYDYAYDLRMEDADGVPDYPFSGTFRFNDRITP